MRVADALAEGRIDDAPITDAEKRLLKFAHALTFDAARAPDSEFEALRAAGWTNPQIAETVYIISLFAFFNRVSDAFGLQEPGLRKNPPPANPGPK